MKIKPGTPIRLLACEAGKGSSSGAQQIANITGSIVQGYTCNLHPHPDGTLDKNDCQPTYFYPRHWYDFLISSAYIVTIGAGLSNIAGTLIDNPGTFSFQTAALVDKNTLTVANWAPLSGATGVSLNAHVQVGCSKPVDAVTLGSSNIELYPYNAGTSFPVLGTITPSSNQMGVTFSPASSLLANTQYCIGLTGIEDLEGDALSGTTTNCFTTGASSQSTGPVVLSVSPAEVEVGLSER